MNQQPIHQKALNFYRVIFCLFALTGLSVGIVQAEPWISNRFAQNCAACHTAGRTNKPAKGRRCTLSCQGCHVNPQGGGLRNTYGKWNSQRWLRSFQSDTLRDEKTPAPLSKQPYKAKVEYLAKGKKVGSKHLKAPRHNSIKETHPDMKLYDKNSWQAWHVDIADENQFLSVIPKEDPYRLERDLSVYAGADVRYFYGTYEIAGIGADRKVDIDGFMSIDVGVRARPTKFHQLSFVLESRIQDAADDYGMNSLDSSSGYLKSAYVLADDLAYNSFVQFGNYRPLFGNMNVSHVSLAQQITGFGGRPTFRTFSVGTAPNIPFFIMNYILESDAHGDSSGSTLGSGDSGLSFSVGGRWVTLGLSTKLSYWKTTRKGSDALIKDWEMYSFTAGGAFGPIIANFETVRVERDKFASTGADSGNVHTLEAKVQLWKETYLTSSYAMSNTSSSLAEGDATEYSYGVKFFPVSGIELEVLAAHRDEKISASNGSLTIDLALLQMHAFF